MSRYVRRHRNEARRERRASQNGAPAEDLIGASHGAPRAPIGRGVAPENVNDAHVAQEAARARDRAQREPYAFNY